MAKLIIDYNPQTARKVLRLASLPSTAPRFKIDIRRQHIKRRTIVQIVAGRTVRRSGSRTVGWRAVGR